MGRKVKIRTSYQNDAGYLMRLSQAVEGDDNRPPEWRGKAIQHLNALVAMFMSDTVANLSTASISKKAK